MNLDNLIELLKKSIKSYQDKIDELTDKNNSTFIKYKELFELLDADINNITTIQEEDLASILAETDLNEEERELEFNYLKSIRKLLNLNQTKNTTFQLTKSQKEYLEVLKHQLIEIEEEAKNKAKDHLKAIKRLREKQKELKIILGIVEDNKNKAFITQIDTINELFELNNIDEPQKREILYSVLKYNYKIYEEEMNSTDEVEKVRLNREEVKELFNTYNYNFEDLTEQQQEDILLYGNIRRIEEVFNCLKEFKFPRFDLKRDASKLIVLLINGERKIIKDIVLYSKEKGIRTQELLMLIPALIKQKNKKGEKKDLLNPTPFISGKSEDYKKNIEFFEEIGFDIRYIFNKCKDILVMSHEKLVYNYRKFTLYGFTIPTDVYGDLCHPALSCLLASNFDEIVDSFIEISRDGHQYIKDNMSRITTTSSPKDILFYNIYASYMEQDDMGEKLIPEGPFSKANNKKLMLRGEITRYSGSGYENTDYREINEDNKREKTMTVEIEYQNKQEFDNAVANSKGKDEELLNLVVNDPRILALDEYLDVNDPVRYDFDGVLISKLKVLRIFNILKNNHLDTLEDSLLYAITYNSIMSQESLDKIKTIIRDRRK